MTSGDVGLVLQRAMFTALAVGGPIIGASMVVGLIVSVFQAATQINEATLSFVPKLVVVAVVLVVFGPGMVQSLVELTRLAFSTAAGVAR
jgi:flagellar biosynthetic protein FliQ